MITNERERQDLYDRHRLALMDSLELSGLSLASWESRFIRSSKRYSSPLSALQRRSCDRMILKYINRLTPW